MWRITNAKWVTTAFSGQGAKTYGGRWNSTGTSVVYTSSSLALAALDSLVHLGVKSIPKPQVAIPADIPEGIPVDQIEPDNLPSTWKDDPPPAALAVIGDQWVATGKSSVLKVPSAVINEEWNYLLNPEHPDFNQIIIGTAKSFQFDARLFT